MSRFSFQENDSIEEIREGAETEKYVSPLGVIKYAIYMHGKWVEQFDDPGWEYVFDEDGSCVSCPNCDELELRYHNGSCCCPNCDSVFSDDDITAYAGSWHHS